MTRQPRSNASRHHNLKLCRGEPLTTQQARPAGERAWPRGAPCQPCQARHHNDIDAQSLSHFDGRVVA